MKEIVNVVEVVDIFKDLLKAKEITTEGVGIEVPNAYCITYNDGMFHVSYCEEDSSVGFGKYEEPEDALQTYVELVTNNFFLAEELKALFVEEKRFREDEYLYYFMGYEADMLE